MSEEPRGRGLPSIEQARQGRGKLRWPSTKFWAYAGVVLAVGFIFLWKQSQAKIESTRQGLMARQRAVAAELGPRWLPMREKIEAWTLELAKEPGAEVVDQEALKAWDFRDRAGLYLRMRVEDATDIKAIRKNAKDSLRDAFTSCLMRVPNPNPLAGAVCKRTRDCATGEMCNENDRCSRPAQPFNLRVAYKTMYVLSDEWVREVQDASTEIRTRLLVAGFEDTVTDDIPLAVEVLTRAQYFLLVLDETPKGEGAPKVEAGENATEALLAVSHPARVAVWSLADGKLILRVRREAGEAGGQLLGALPSLETEVMAAVQRQRNSCALALAVRQAMGDTAAAATPAPPQ